MCLKTILDRALVSVFERLYLCLNATRLSAARNHLPQVAEFHRCLKLFGQSSPPLVIIDSIDQMSNTFQERTQPWRWLPAPDADIGGAVVVPYPSPPLLQCAVHKRDKLKERTCTP